MSGIPEMNTQLWASNNSFVVAMYYRVAFQVSMANEFLRQTTEAKLAERNVSPELAADIQIFRAEARFLRALSYWHGIDIFGNIPLVTEEDPIGPTAPLQSTRAGDLRFPGERADRHPGRSARDCGPGTYGRATKEAAAMLLAKLYLNAGVYTGTPQYAQALAAAQQVIAGPFTLDPSYRHLFQADNHTSPEIIFPVIQDGKLTKSYGGTTFLIHASCGGSMAPGDQGVNGCWFGLRLKPEAYDRFLLPARTRGGRSSGPTARPWTSPASATSPTAWRSKSSRTRQVPEPTAPTSSFPTPTSRCSGWVMPISCTPRPTSGAAAATGRRPWPT